MRTRASSGPAFQAWWGVPGGATATVPGPPSVSASPILKRAVPFDPFAPEVLRKQQLAALRDQLERKAG